MNERFEEQTAIFFSIVKWIILAVIVGILVGASTTLFLKLLKISIDYTSNYTYYFISLPIVLIFCTWLTNNLAPQSKGHGTEKVIEAVHRNNGRTKFGVMPVKLFTTIITIAAGGSVGKEGPSGQIGAAIASAFSDIFRLNDVDRKKLVICGISAGFAGVFGTPISGAIFGLEVLYVGAIMYDVMLPSFISGIVAYQVCSFFGITYFHNKISFIPQFTESFFMLVILGGIVFGSVSFLLIEAFRTFETRVDRWKLNVYLKNALGGIFLVGLVFLLGTRYCGLGIGTFENILNGRDPVLWDDFLLKIVFTIITLSFGGSGGVVTPIFFIGIATGSLFAEVLHLDNSTFAAIGMVSLLSGAANTPIAASIMGLELFGSSIAPYAAISCVISFLMTGHRSIYPSQILSFKKSTSINVDIGKEMHDVEASVKSKERYALYRFWKLWKFRK